MTTYSLIGPFSNQIRKSDWIQRKKKEKKFRLCLSISRIYY